MPAILPNPVNCGNLVRAGATSRLATRRLVKAKESAQDSPLADKTGPIGKSTVEPQPGSASEAGSCACHRSNAEPCHPGHGEGRQPHEAKTWPQQPQDSKCKGGAEQRGRRKKDQHGPRNSISFEMLSLLTAHRGLGRIFDGMGTPRLPVRLWLFFACVLAGCSPKTPPIPTPAGPQAPATSTPFQPGALDLLRRRSLLRACFQLLHRTRRIRCRL